MPKYRKKPVVIEAEKVGLIINAFKAKDLSGLPQWLLDAYDSEDFDVLINEENPQFSAVWIRTLEGQIYTGKRSSWVVRGVRGELYPVDDEIFKETYEEVLTETVPSPHGNYNIYIDTGSNGQTEAYGTVLNLGCLFDGLSSKDVPMMMTCGCPKCSPHC